MGVAAETVTQVIDRLETSDFVKRETLVYQTDDTPPPQKEATPTPAEAEKMVREERAVYLKPFYYSEIGVTNRVRQLVESPGSRLRSLRDINNTEIARGNEADPMRLSTQQMAAIRTAVANKVTILTGGPGTGKTTTLRALLDLLDRHGNSYVLASPTGRAAKRLTETTGREAKTIHRLLEVSPSEGFKFQRNQDNPLECDMLIVDECSMVDLILMNSLLKAVHPASHVLLVGDVDQLPSVGAGNVLKDMEYDPVADADNALTSSASSSALSRSA